jgi:hypothetical protein
MPRGRNKPPYLVCETCGKHTDHVRRDVLDANYNALGKTPFWNCDECYQAKRQARLARTAAEAAPADRSSS